MNDIEEDRFSIHIRDTLRWNDIEATRFIAEMQSVVLSPASMA